MQVVTVISKIRHNTISIDFIPDNFVPYSYRNTHSKLSQSTLT